MNPASLLTIDANPIIHDKSNNIQTGQPTTPHRADLPRNQSDNTIATNRTGTVNAANYIAWLRCNGYALGSLAEQFSPTPSSCLAPSGP